MSKLYGTVPAKVAVVGRLLPNGGGLHVGPAPIECPPLRPDQLARLRRKVWQTFHDQPFYARVWSGK